MPLTSSASTTLVSGARRLPLAAAAAIIAVFANTLWNDWTYDDHYVAGSNRFVQEWRNWGRVFSADYFTLAREGSWRPVVTTSYFLDASIWGENPYGFHLTNLALHLAVALLLLARLRGLGFRDAAALAGTLAFALHPGACEAVAGVGFREDMLAALFGLAAWAALDGMGAASGPRKWTSALGGALCILLAQLSKENALAWPLLFGLWAALRLFPGPPHGGTPRAPLLLACAGAGAGLALQFGVFVFEAPTDKAWIFGDRGVSWLGAPLVFARYMALTVFPLRLSAEHPWPVAPESAAAHAALGVAFGVALLAGTVVLWRRAPRVAGGWLLFAAPLAPVCGLAPMAQPFAERFLYLPLLGAGWLAAEGVERALARAGAARDPLRALRACGIGIGAALALLGMRSTLRTFDWRDNIALFAPVGERNPQSARGLTALGLRLAREERYAEAESRFRQALELNEESPAVWSHLANALGAQGRNEAAATAAGRATELWPEFIDAHRNAAIFWMRADPPRPDRAQTHIDALRIMGVEGEVINEE